MRSAVVATGVTSTRTGSFSRLAARPWTACGMVAENSSVWRSFGSLATMRFTGTDEAHVEHAVGLVEHEGLEAVEPHVALVHQVEQTARCRHQDVDAARQVVHLRALADAAEDRRRG